MIDALLKLKVQDAQDRIKEEVEDAAAEHAQAFKNKYKKGYKDAREKARTNQPAYNKLIQKE